MNFRKTLEGEQNDGFSIRKSGVRNFNAINSSLVRFNFKLFAQVTIRRPTWLTNRGCPSVCALYNAKAINKTFYVLPQQKKKEENWNISELRQQMVRVTPNTYCTIDKRGRLLEKSNIYRAHMLRVQ